MAKLTPGPTPKSALTLEQQRAADAWRCAQSQKSSEYANLAKSLPAMIMNSGLLQIMAFLHEKGGKQSQAHCRVLGTHLRAWVHTRFPEVPDEFEGFMTAVINSESQKFQMITMECLAWLRWLRQIAAAVSTASTSSVAGER